MKELHTEKYKTVIKLKIIQTNGRILHALGLEELILLKGPYYPKQSKNLMWSLSNYSWYFFQRTRINNPKIYMGSQKT